MKLTESSQNNADAGNDHDSVQVELHDQVKELNHTVTEQSLKESEIQDEKKLGLSSENGGESVEETHESVVSDVEWVCKSPDGGLSSGWPAFNTKPRSYPYSLVGNEEAIVAVLHLQHNAIDACQKFLAPKGSDSDEDVIEDEDEDDDESEDELAENSDEESKEYKFFEKLFAEDVELRKYYENNCKEGDFYCLVCGGIKKKMWKRFKDCVALIQHSTAVLRTKRMRAHRAYAQVVCKVVGWDINQLPTIASKDLDSSSTAKLLVEPEKPVAASGVDDQNVTHESVVSDAEWVCKSPDVRLSSTASEWPAFNTKPCSYPYSLVGDEEAIVAVLHLQHNAIDACQKFLAPDVGSDSDEDVIEDEDEDDDEGEDESAENCDEESEVYKFFEKVFAEDDGLRKYYEDNSKKGDFYCLVCGGIKKKMWKRFKDCFALIQHATTVLRTKRKRAHRAYAQVVCKVVGWDINQLPAIVLKDLDSSLPASKKLLVKPEKPVAVSGADDQNGELVNSVDDN